MDGYNALMASFLRAKNVIHIENVVAILIVVSIILGWLAGLRQDPAGIPRRLVFETWVADSVGCREVYRQRLQGLGTAFVLANRDASGSERGGEKSGREGF